jgi:hypothetical protein
LEAAEPDAAALEPGPPEAETEAEAEADEDDAANECASPLGGDTEWCDSEAGESDDGDEYEVERDEAAADDVADAEVDEVARELLGCDCDWDEGDEFDGCMGPP